MGSTKKRRSSARLALIAAILLTLALAAALTVGYAAKRFRDADTIAPNVTVQGVSVGGLSTSQADQAVRDEWVARLPQQVELRYGDGVLKSSPQQLGVRLQLREALEQALRVGREGTLLALVIQHVKLRHAGVNVPVTSTVDRAALEAHLAGIAGTIERTPRNADIRVVGDRVEVVPGEEGRRLDTPASVAKLARALANPELRAIDLVVKTQPPTIRAEDLQHLEVVLASYTTRYRAWQTNRTHNLRLALGSLSRAVLMPGDVLSLNERIGPRLEERGFRSAPIFVNGEVEPSTGGGVCQVATTVYNAALLAGLDVLERHHHSRPVDYARSGRDATVYWGQLDLRIRNSLAHPILFLGDIDGGSMTVRILGSRSDHCDVDIARSGISSISYATKELPDPALEQGKRVVDKKGRSGACVTVSRTIKQGGRVLKTEKLHSDVYAPQTQVVRVGTMPPQPPVAPPGTSPTAPGALPRPTGKPAAPSVPASSSGHGATPHPPEAGTANRG